jgi:hypothetical protein
MDARPASARAPGLVSRILGGLLVAALAFAASTAALPWGRFTSEGTDGKAASWTATLWRVCMSGSQMQPQG